MKLVREVRFSVGGERTAASGGSVLQRAQIGDSYAGWPPSTGIQPYLVLRLGLEGEPDPITGYLCNINVLDRLVRELTIPQIERLLPAGAVCVQPVTPAPGGGGHQPSTEAPCAERVLLAIAPELQAHAPTTTRLASLELCLTPFLSYEVRSGDPNMIYLTQAFEFAAAHRLHCPTLSERENRDTFGKCNNLNGHGHNYVVEVTVAGEPERSTGRLIPLERMEATVKQRVIDRFDHKHLNADCPEFADLNPTVEHIARTIWSLLEGQFAPARLARVRVWETSKTYAEYEG